MLEISKGSLIWNSTIQHRDLIQKHSFWEVKEGLTARFWTDSWQQLPNLKDCIQGITEQEINQQDKVSNFWKTQTTQDHREWKNVGLILLGSSNHTQMSLTSEFQKRKIIRTRGIDALRWGYEEKGTFTTREAYQIIIKDTSHKDKIWDKIWQPPIWPKVSTFLWLLSHNRILTWDNLRKRNFFGPSICLNCYQEEESALHLMQTCQLGRKLWEKVSFRCQREGRELGDIKGTLRNWTQAPFQSKILNTLWQIIPGLPMWNIWKERNRRIFKNQSMTLEKIWKGLHQNINETLSIKSWTKEDFPSQPQEQTIWKNWQIQIQTPTVGNDNSSRHQTDKASWRPPPFRVFQLNFDGASRGNPGQTGFGGVIRDHQGKPLTTFFGSIGWNTNNATELESLWRGLTLAQEHRYFPLIVEGDSQILINMALKIQQGSSIHKFSSSWRMATRLEGLQNWLQENRAISFKHIKREGNTLADFLANLGVDNGKDFFAGSIQGTATKDQLSNFHAILNKDMQKREESYPEAGNIRS